MFIDETEIIVRGGKGGRGCCAFRREAYMPRGGPDGGNGGKGGDVYLEADEQLSTLFDITNQAEYVAENGVPGQGKTRHGRSGKDALRGKGTIGMHAVRAGDITGVHSVMFGSQGETVTLGHTANSRDTFVRGALRAAKWLAGKKPGLYSMADVLGIK